jgi:CheY-like chemotaxis protein
METTSKSLAISLQVLIVDDVALNRKMLMRLLKTKVMFVMKL